MFITTTAVILRSLHQAISNKEGDKVLGIESKEFYMGIAGALYIASCLYAIYRLMRHLHQNHVLERVLETIAPKTTPTLRP